MSGVQFAPARKLRAGHTLNSRLHTLMGQGMQNPAHFDEQIDATSEPSRPVMDRRSFIRGGIAGATSIAFAAFLARRADAAELPYSDHYGPVAPVLDTTTGLPLISLPAGFTYRSFGWRATTSRAAVRAPTRSPLPLPTRMPMAAAARPTCCSITCWANGSRRMVP